ncbi:low-density lipoprotein receptor-related protein-like [Tetranychus urticae]|uniref:low-density lipoprotein receptor-related protein-like n=1 Tax=Tetranychus urticae TaxID=32264 RepID=UPI000355AD3B|nr:low-density lipoprotein receptor-related protein-like [Tetranychus urticae]
MKGQNTSWKSYSSCVTINHCLLTFLIGILSINCSHGFVLSFGATEDYQEPSEKYPKIFEDAVTEFLPEDVTIKPSQEKHPSTMNPHSTFHFQSSEESPRTTVHDHTEDVTTTTMSPLLLYHYVEPILTVTPKAPEDNFPISTDYVHTTTAQYRHENRFTEDVTTMKTQESIWISDSSTAGTLTEVDTYTYATKDTPKTPKDNFPGINDGVTPTIHVSDSSTGNIIVMQAPDLIRLPESNHEHTIILSTTTSTTESTAQSQTSYDVLVPASREIDSKTFEPSVDNPWPTVKCDADEFSCHSRRLCIKTHLVCDGINDCDDGSDEFECESATQTISPDLICVNDECPRSYERNPNPPQCTKWDFNNIACKHHKGNVPLIVFSTLNALYENNLPEDRSKIQVDKEIQFDLSGISAFDYENINDTVIYLDRSENKIFAVPFIPILDVIAVQERRVAINGTHGWIHGFAYDWMNNALIWIDDYGIRSKRFLRNFLGNDQPKLYRTLDPSYDWPGAITIDVKKQCIFWTNIGADPNRPFDFPVYIERIDISGEPRTQKIVETNILRPVGLAIDAKNTKVYWIDGLYGTLESVGYDGTNRIILYESLPFMDELISMDIFSNYLYFTDKANSTIQRININNAVKKVDTLVSVPYGPPTWVKIFEPSEQFSTFYLGRLPNLKPWKELDLESPTEIASI